MSFLIADIPDAMTRRLSGGDFKEVISLMMLECVNTGPILLPS
jgi:hypothetical protein